MSYYNKEPPTCKYCSTEKNKTLIKFKKKEDGKWDVMNMDGTRHDRVYCDQMKVKNNSQQQAAQPQTKPISSYVGGTSTFPVNEEPKQSQGGVSIFSLHIMVSEQRKETKELRKQIETLASIIDSMAQKQDLLIEKIGYPKPEPVLPPERQKAYEENSKQFDKVMTKVEQSRDFKCNSCGVIFTKGRVDKDRDLYLCQNCIPKEPVQEIKAEQKSLSPEEMKEVINPMRVQPDPEREKSFENAKTLTLGDIPASPMNWEQISEAFICHNCSGKCHNGYTKLGTRLCPDCKNKIESQETEDKTENDRSDVNDFNPRIRTIEEINNDERYDF